MLCLVQSRCSNKSKVIHNRDDVDNNNDKDNHHHDDDDDDYDGPANNDEQRLRLIISRPCPSEVPRRRSEGTT